MQRFPLYISIFAIPILLFTIGATAENRVQAKLISDAETAEAGSAISIGVFFDIPERAHIYWRNPGDSGLATGVEWETSSGIEAGELKWPVPRQFSVEGLNEAYFGYTDEVLLFSRFQIPKNLADGTTFTIKANVQWLLCLDDGVCLPEDAELEISIPAHEESRKAYEATMFAKYAPQVPTSKSKSGFRGQVLWTEETTLAVIVELPEGDKKFESTKFFPFNGGGWSEEVAAGRIIFKPDYKGDAFKGGVVVLRAIGDGKSEQHIYIIELKGPSSP